MESGPSRAVTCRNCGRRFDGRFCPDCGQEAEEVRRPFADLARGFLSDVLAFDARIWRTLKPLFLRPGHLTREYFTGHRVRYVPPLRLYVFAGAVFFAVMAVTGGGPYRLVVEREGEAGSIEFQQGVIEREDTAESNGSAEQTDSEGGVSEGTAGEAVESSGVGAWVEERIDRALEEPEEFNAAVIDTLSYLHFVMLPLFALLLKVFWRRRYFVEHLVLSLHFHALALLPSVVYVAVWAALSPDPEHPVADVFTPLWTIVLAVWLYLALRRLYAGRRWSTAWRTLAVGWLYLMLTGIVMMGVAFVTLVIME